MTWKARCWKQQRQHQHVAAKHGFLQVAAHHGYELKKADVSGAFLQGREQQAYRYVVPVNELPDTLGITKGKPARLRKAGDGLVIAPKEWVKSVYDGKKEIGLGAVQDRSVRKRHKDHSCKCWCCFTLTISCWPDAKVKLVGKSFNG